MDEKFKLAGNRRMCGIANDVSRPIVLNDMHDEYTLYSTKVCSNLLT